MSLELNDLPIEIWLTYEHETTIGNRCKHGKSEYITHTIFGDWIFNDMNELTCFEDKSGQRYE